MGESSMNTVAHPWGHPGQLAEAAGLTPAPRQCRRGAGPALGCQQRCPNTSIRQADVISSLSSPSPSPPPAWPCEKAKNREERRKKLKLLTKGASASSCQLLPAPHSGQRRSVSSSPKPPPPPGSPGSHPLISAVSPACLPARRLCGGFTAPAPAPSAAGRRLPEAPDPLQLTWVPTGTLGAGDGDPGGVQLACQGHGDGDPSGSAGTLRAWDGDLRGSAGMLGAWDGDEDAGGPTGTLRE